MPDNALFANRASAQLLRFLARDVRTVLQMGFGCVRGGLEPLGFSLFVPSTNDIGDAAGSSATEDVSRLGVADSAFVACSAVVYHAVEVGS